MGGWLHRLDGAAPVYIPNPEPVRVPAIDAGAMMKRWRSTTTAAQINAMAGSLGVEGWALDALGAAFAPEHGAWAFPMKDVAGLTVGVRLRTPAGDKFAVKGSRQGVFLPPEMRSRLVYVCEGPTDTAALISIGCVAIGRPSCMGCEMPIASALARLGCGRVVIVTDSDAPGLAGARKLQASLKLPSCLWCPPAKDARSFVQAGGDAATLRALTQGVQWTTFR